MFIEYIERLRKEPREVRERAAYFWTVVSVVVLVGLYIIIRIVLAFSGGDAVPVETTIASPYGSTTSE